MIFSGITPTQVEHIVTRVSAERYGNNVVPKWVKHQHLPTWLSANRFRGQITVYRSDGPGARRAASGRRLVAACWHVFRDVIGPMLMEHGARRITTSIANYTRDNWEETFPGTAYRNVGSLIDPVDLDETCDCEISSTDSSSRPVRRESAATRPHSRPLFPQSPLFEKGEGYLDALARIDRVLAGAEYVKMGECATCGNPTGSSDMVWCSFDCQTTYQAHSVGVQPQF